MVNGCQICSTHSRPQEAEVGLLCERCVQALRQTIVDLELCLLAISAVPGKSGPQAEPVSGNKPGSRSPANDNAIIHTDLRTAWSQEDGFGAFSVLHEWAVEAREHEGVEPPERITVTSESQALQNALRQIAGADWIVDASEEIKAAYRAVRRVVGLGSDRPLGRCPDGECAGKAYSTINRVGVECRTCKRTFHAVDMVAMSQTGERRLMDRATLAELMGVTERVIRRRFEVARYIDKKAYYDLDECYSRGGEIDGQQAV